LAGSRAAPPRAPIYYLSHSYVPSRYANSIQVMRMCEALAVHAGPLELFCRRQRLSQCDPFAHYGVRSCFRVRSLWAPQVRVLGRLCYTALGLLRVLALPRPRLIYARDSYLLGVLAVLGLCRAPTVLEVHQPPQDDLERALMRRIFADPHFARLVVISRALDERYRALFGDLLGNRIVVAPDAAALLPVPVGAAAQPCEPDRGRPFTLGYAGSLKPGKGIELIAALAERLPDVAFEVLGGAPEEVGAWRARCKVPNFRLRGFVPPAEVSPALAGCDALLAPYQPRVLVGPKRVDIAPWMSPLKIFEAMANGRPILASDVPAVREVLHDGHNALLAPPDDIDAWVDRIRALQRDPSIGRALAARARREVEQTHNWEQRAQMILAAVVPD
jgi:glycosyltransferase involved in cell wall biosynthesis